MRLIRILVVSEHLEHGLFPVSTYGSDLRL